MPLDNVSLGASVGFRSRSDARQLYLPVGRAANGSCPETEDGLDQYNSKSLLRLRTLRAGEPEPLHAIVVGRLADVHIAFGVHGECVHKHDLSAVSASAATGEGAQDL